MKKGNCKNKNKKTKIFSVIVIGILIMAGYLITIFTHPTFLMYSDTNTSVYIGNVTNIIYQKDNFIIFDFFFSIIFLN